MTAPAFTVCGKEILRNGKHFLDAASPEIAEAVLIMLTKGRLFSSDIGQAELDEVRSIIWA